MAARTPPSWLQAGSHPAENDRLALAALLGSPSFTAFSGGIQATSAGGGHGVVGASDLLVTQNGTPNMSVNVAVGACWIRGTEASDQGCYNGLNDAILNLSIAAADPTNARKDLIVARVRDAEYSGASNDFGLFVVTGTPAGSPVDPAVPANCLVVARVNVAAGAGSILDANIDDLRTRSYALGGIAVCTSTTRPSGASLYEGLVIYETNTDTFLYWTGTLWQPLHIVYSASGNAGWTASATLAAVTGATITLPAGKWIVQSNGAFDHATGTSRDYAAQIWNNTDSSQVDLVNANAGDLSAKPAWSLFGVVSITASKTFILRAQTSAVDGTQLMGRWHLWATPVTASQ